MVSIIIPVICRSDLLMVCLDSIIKYTVTPYEIIVVQEGIDDKLTNIINGYDVKFVQNRKPKGFAGAMNTGLALASGDFYCFLNHDIVATPGWLESMLLAFNQPDVGLVTPTFTESDTKQNVDWNKGQEFDFIDDPLSLKGVCFLIKKEVIDKIGEWDESFGLGGGDDNDMCFRIQKAGYKLVIARHSYIYHYGSASFRELFDNDIDYSKKYAVGQFKKFQNKWEKDRKPKIFVAIPNRGSISNQLDNCLVHWSHDSRWIVKYYKPEGLMPVDAARNHCVKVFLEDYCDYLLFIDDDITPPLNMLEVLLAHDKDVVGSLSFCMSYNDEGLLAPFAVSTRKNENDEQKQYIGNGLEEVDATGASCLLIKRKVLEDMERPFCFKYKSNGLLEQGEDLTFCDKVKEMGFEIWVDFNLVSGHIKSINITDINELMVRYGR